MRRVLAVVASLVMVSGAVLLRSRVDSNGSHRETGSTKGSGGQIQVTCVTELKDVCGAIDGQDKIRTTTEDADKTFKRLTESSANVPDAWLTLAPWPGMVDAQRQANPLFAKKNAPVIASAPLVLVTSRERSSRLGALCPGNALPCLAQRAGTNWPEFGEGMIALGIPASASALRPSVLGLISLGNHGGSRTFGSNDFTPDDLRLHDLNTDDSNASSLDQLEVFLQKNLTEYTAVVAPRPAGEQIIKTQQGIDHQLTVVEPQPSARGDVVVAVRSSDASSTVEKALKSNAARDAVTAAGFTPGAPKSATGLPDDDVLLALWKGTS